MSDITDDIIELIKADMVPNLDNHPAYILTRDIFYLADDQLLVRIIWMGMVSLAVRHTFEQLPPPTNVSDEIKYQAIRDVTKAFWDGAMAL